jgi:hypothetical protein
MKRKEKKKMKKREVGSTVVQETHTSPITALDSFDFPPPPITTLPLRTFSPSRFYPFL